jgi:predicted PurR-regulated permease PerM
MFYQFLAPFLLPLFLAAVLAIVCQPLYCRILLIVGPKRRSWAAGVTTALVLAVVLIPALIGTVVAAQQLVGFTRTYLSADTISESRLWKDVLAPAWERLPEWMKESDETTTPQQQLAANAEGLARTLAKTTLSLASSTVGALVSLTIATGMFLIAFFYFLQDGPTLIAAAEEFIPIPVEHQRELCLRFTKVTRAVVLATFLAAFAQGIATTLALQVLGFGHLLVFLVVATISALVPVAGTWVVWAPCAVWLALQGHWGSAIGLAIWGGGVVGVLDNIVRTYILNSDAELHPLLAFVSVLGALQVMGLWGIFIGPIAASCLSALIQIVNQELKLLNPREGTGPPAVLVNPVRGEADAKTPAVVASAGTAATAKDTNKSS